MGCQTSEGFVGQAKSTISPSVDVNLPETIKVRRNNARIENDVLLEDELFDSPSAAGMFVVGKRGVNGVTSWKTKEGRTLKEVEGGTLESGEEQDGLITDSG